MLEVALLCTGCIEGFDTANGTDRAYYRLYDYTIDRPRVMGISFWPVVFSSGDRVTFQAFAATPDALTTPHVEWWGCGVNLSEPFIYYGADCLNTSIAEKLGEGTSLTMTMPEYDTSSCQTTGCYGYLPLIAMVRSESGADADVGYGVTYLIPDYLDQYGQLNYQSDLHYADVTLSVNGDSSGTVSAKRGSAVSLEARVVSVDDDFQYSWYVSAGTLDDLGITRADEVVYGVRFRPNSVYGHNTLRIPDDFAGSSIQLYAVIDPVDVYTPGLERFLTATVAVTP